MKVAGIGFREAATAADLAAALALCDQSVDAIASIAAKAHTPAMQDFARSIGLPVIALQEQDIAGEQTLTCSPRIKARFATGSLAEAAALAGARHGVAGAKARLLAPRVVTADGLATAAIAERLEP
ncbi:cobalamin biosynthesis protein [Phaeobacter gallaeciensis]|uniref:Cobalamin synthesis G n=1 Tax=Phaeobacter gallaeciensis TaxID=60890 RepID=A0AAD0EDM1_9RHOB|nr:cobalamin biosynthesis protein [Phaeobacter gallaeciensis]AHD10417.1 Cobalamin synthesis G [Phaeobacter gallaeciensis DSM 26640]ATE93680.1 Cobalamin synthesis G [Phaeobacter gallaeciensis]ATE96499.1 Cobalamin synthesis G [Phaeobacter gallaeciensis]ATF02344.1 Cobalamin synthesis G [Phaeobacter gallaeciensis]ATF06724.1 Cobalamin synthesis G [Phaeobacter gallaeciensis]